MFPIVVNDGQTPFPEDDIYYIVCKEGVYLKKTLGVMDSIAPVKNISILQSIQASAQMHIKKMPAKMAMEILNFFRAVYEEHYSEAIVLLFYNQQTKKYKVVCPFQEVSGAAADYNKGITIEDYDMIGTIHSHASFSAFHSGIDDKDEESFDGLHITFGHMKDEDITISASIVANGYRVIVDPREYINQLEMTLDIDDEIKVPYAKTWKWDKGQKKMLEVQTNKFYTRKNKEQRFKIRLAKDPKFNPAWMERVTKKTYTYNRYNARGAQGWYGWGGHNVHHDDFDSKYWENWNGHNVNGVLVPATSKAVTTVPPPKHTSTKKDVSPCDACTFKHHKVGFMLNTLDDQGKKEALAWALNEINSSPEYSIRDLSAKDDDDVTNYACVACGSRIAVDETEDDGACCPTCETDDYLEEITDAELMMTDVEFQHHMFGAVETEKDDDVPKMISCHSCGSSFTKSFLNNDNVCPACNTTLIEGFEFNSEDYKINQGRSDSGTFLDPDREEIEQAAEADKAAMEAAAEADKNLEKIPIPDQDAAPLPLRQSSLVDMFTSVFRKSGRKK